MRIGIVSDIHSNVEGLRLALSRMGDVDELLCAGDVVQEYRFSNEVIELLRERRARIVLGNHDIVLLSPHGERARAAPTVRFGNVEYLAGQPMRVEMDIDGKKLLMVHASPVPPCTQYVYTRTPELRQLAEIEADFIILGHTHAQMAQRVGRALVINPGSTGEARDHTNGRRLSYAVLDTATEEVLVDNYLVGDPEEPAFTPCAG
jgi:putative phosphoesterase